MKETREQRRARRLAHERLRRRVAFEPREGDRIIQRYPDGSTRQCSVVGPRNAFGSQPVIVMRHHPHWPHLPIVLYYFTAERWRCRVRTAHVITELPCATA